MSRGQLGIKILIGAAAIFALGGCASSTTVNSSGYSSGYGEAVATDAHALDDAFRTANACGDFAGCSVAATGVGTASQQFLNDLADQPVPPGLESFDGALREALSWFTSGSQEQVSGIAYMDAGLYASGTDMIQQGATMLSAALSEMG